MAKIALTGADGMIGRHMAALLASENIAFKSINRKVWDLSVWKTLEELDFIFEDIDAIFHFGAALPKGTDATNSNLETNIIFDVNVRSCLNLAEWAYLRKKTIVFISGATVYQNPYDLKISENSREAVNGFGGFYGYSKLLAEKVIAHYVEAGLKAVLLRPSSVYGYGLGEGKLINNYLKLASKGMTINISEPYNRINFIHAYDVSNAALKAFNNNAWGTFNIGADESVSIEFLASTCISVYNSGEIKIAESIAGNENIFTRFDLDCSKAKNEFSFKNSLSMYEGLKLMIEKRMLPC